MRERRDGPERHDAETDPAWTGGRLPWIEASRTTASICFARVVGDGMSARSNGQREVPPGRGTCQDLQPVLREERAGPGGMSEGFIVPTKPVNAGGGKGPEQDANEVAREEAIDPWV